MAKSDFGATNIFNITDPHLYRSQVMQYHNKLSRLVIGVTKENAPVFYLLLVDVGYMECPTNWQGMHFDIGTQDECIALMLETGLIGQAILRFPNAYASLTEYARLYTVRHESARIRFIASSATLLPGMPKELG